MTRVVVIGLDCATPQFVFDSWRRDLPVLDRLMREGIYGDLKSTIPPITVPAWTSMLSSKDPGQLGVYGFRNRKSYGYEELYFANASYIREKMVWDYLEEAGLTSILIGVPQTFPPKPLRGILIGSFLTPDKSADYTYPAAVKEELDRIADGDYIIDVRSFRTDDKDWLLDEIYRMTQRRFKVVRYYLERGGWDFFMVVEMGIDRIHHGFWRYQDTGHRLYQPGNPYENAIKKYYQYVDGEIGDLLTCLDSDTSVMVVSDHGAKKMDGAICINEWLIEQGYLHLNRGVDKPTRLTADMIDWTKTRVWGEGGYYSRIFLNVQGREPQGIVPQREYEAFRDRLKKELESLGDEDGRAIGTRVFKPQDIYRCVKNIPPDLIVYFGDLNWRGAGMVGHGRVHIYENDTGPDDANHAENGIFVLSTDPARLDQAGLVAGQRVQGLLLYDVAPTILDLFGRTIPSDMIGRSIFRSGAERGATRPDTEPRPQGQDYSEEEEEAIRKHLEDLGYL
jgi:predicted AlkP superfamily phosphohydrolase/phosphomutase